ncbi:MAG: cyclic nucleotide-binding domain-containing protein [Rhizobiaceae bacterium]|nr:cyclic nucleotide-binding domain-containing protein [Rhizobiaceae bacterium]
MEIVVFKEGDTIISEGDEGETAFLIVYGEVEVFKGVGSKCKSMAQLSAGEIFGEMSLLDPGPRSATVKALAQTKCLATSYDDFISSFQNNPEQAAMFMKTLVRRLRQMNDMIISLDPKKRSFRDMIGDWQRTIAFSDDIELTDEEKEQNLTRMQSQMPFY